jgi:dUTP pyrophosphatase
MSGASVLVQRVRDGFDDLPLPSYATAGAAGIDLRAAIDETITVEPGRRMAIPTGIAIALPPGFECQVRPRSGLAVKNGVTVLNTPGTVDEDYRGEIHVILVNLGDEPFTVERGSRIAQAVFSRYERVALDEVDALETSGRGAGGFGSTGVA